MGGVFLDAYFLRESGSCQGSRWPLPFEQMPFPQRGGQRGWEEYSGKARSMQGPWPGRTSGPRAGWEPSPCWLWRFMGGIELFHPLLSGSPRGEVRDNWMG